jgi:hypothetical protein
MATNGSIETEPMTLGRRALRDSPTTAASPWVLLTSPPTRESVSLGFTKVVEEQFVDFKWSSAEEHRSRHNCFAKMSSITTSLCPRRARCRCVGIPDRIDRRTGTRQGRDPT